LQFFIPVPGCTTGYIGPGGRADMGANWNCPGGAHGYLDRLILGVTHIYQHPTCQDIFACPAYDPEGLLGTLTSIVMTYIGVHMGRILRQFPTPRGRLLRWLSWAAVLGALALALSAASENGGWIPINKNLWSPSFIFATASLGLMLLSTFYLISDVIGLWGGAPFTWLGMNSLLIYVCHGLFQSRFPLIFDNDGSHGMILLSNLIGVGCWLVIAFRMWQLEFFVRI